MLKVGDEKNFSFNKEAHILREIVEQPNISMWHMYKETVCPHCKKKIEQSKEIFFDYIYFFVPKRIEKTESTKLSDVVVLGVDNKAGFYMITEDKLNEVFSKSEKFKHLEVK